LDEIQGGALILFGGVYAYDENKISVPTKKFAKCGSPLLPFT